LGTNPASASAHRTSLYDRGSSNLSHGARIV